MPQTLETSARRSDLLSHIDPTFISSKTNILTPYCDDQGDNLFRSARRAAYHAHYEPVRWTPDMRRSL
jgi:hypothetical protein